MWSSHNSGNKGIPAQNGAEDNNNQSNNTNQVNFQENYQGSEVNVGSENFVNFSPLTAGFPMYPLFAFDYYQPHNSNFYMPNMFQPIPGFGNTGFIQTAFTNTVNSEEVQPQPLVAPTRSGVSALSVPSSRSTQSAQPGTPTQAITLVKPATNMALNLRAEELKAQLIKSKEERAKAKNVQKTVGADTLDPTSQEMASLLRGSPTVPRNQSRDPKSKCTVFSVSPKEIPRGVVVVNTGSKLTQNGNLTDVIAAESKAHEKEGTKLIAGSKSAAENYKKNIGASELRASNIQPSSDAGGVVQNNAQPKVSQTRPKATSQVKASQLIEQKTAISKELQETVQTKEVVGKGGLPSAPSGVEKQILIKTPSSTVTQDKKPASRHEYSGRHGPDSNAVGRPRIDNCDKDKNNTSAKNGINTIHSPEEDGHSPLEKVLLSNDDLRDWLKMTKWDDTAHRRRVLERHRAITAIDTEKARLLESVVKIAALDKERDKLEAEMTEDEDEFGVKSPGRPPTRSTTRAIGSSNSDSEDPLGQATKPKAASVTPRKRSFSSFTNSNRIPLQSNSRRSRATDAQRSSTSNSGKDLFHDRHEHRGRSRERRGFNNPRNMSPRLRAFLDREEAREAREAREDARDARESAARRHNEFRGNHRGDYRPYRGYRGYGRGRGRGDYDQ